MINLPREKTGELLDTAERALIERGYPANRKPAPRWVAAVVLATLAPELIPGSTIEDSVVP